MKRAISGRTVGLGQLVLGARRYAVPNLHREPLLYSIGTTHHLRRYPSNTPSAASLSRFRFSSIAYNSEGRSNSSASESVSKSIVDSTGGSNADSSSGNPMRKAKSASDWHSPPKPEQAQSNEINKYKLVDAVQGVLAQQRELVEALTDSQYTKVSDLVPGSVGGHLRHALDHYSKVLGLFQREAMEKLPVVDYDTRDRGTAVETCRGSCLEEIDRMSQLCNKVRKFLDCEIIFLHRPSSVKLFYIRTSSALTLKSPVKAKFLLNSHESEAMRRHGTFLSTVERELSFVVHHAIHHNAMISILAKEMNIKMPSGFGLAPSTAAFQADKRC